MTLRRIVLIGIILAAVGAGVIRIRLMTTAAARQVHLLAAEQQHLGQQILQQQLQLSRLRTPVNLAARIEAMGVDVQPPGTRSDPIQVRLRSAGSRFNRYAVSVAGGSARR